MKRVLLLLPALAVAALALNWALARPSHDRAWRAEYARLPEVERLSDRVRLRNVRNWDYAPDGTPRARDWIDVEIDPAKLTGTYFLMEPFGSVDAIAHTMLAFAFEDGSAYVASIEARREEDESYDAVKAAVLPVFEYMFVWTTERDMYGNSEFVAGDALYMYELNLPPDQQRAVLDAMLAGTADLAARPRFYNTLFSNCTNVLARTINDVNKGAVPFHMAWYLPGYADEFLFERGFLKRAGGFARTRDAAHISPLVRAAYGESDPVAFSRALRDALQIR